MSSLPCFARRGVVEGFFGPLWSMAHRRRLLQAAGARDMNTYLYAPKDDPYHRERWMEPYPADQWRALSGLIGHAQRHGIDFVYGFHPGQGLSFGADRPIRILLSKARRFYDKGVRIFAVLFDDIPSRLEFAADRRRFKNSLARAQGTWLAEILARQPAAWRDVEWWICPSYYTADPLLARVFGAFEESFLETLAAHLPDGIACFWTGPSVVSDKISLGHARNVARRLNHPLILWDNYPVNDLSMREELHIGPLQQRDPRLPQTVYGYLSNPLLQEELSFVPLATCFDYAANPAAYDPELSWRAVIRRRFGAAAIRHWRTVREFSERSRRGKKQQRTPPLSAHELRRLAAASAYLHEHRRTKWGREIEPWRRQIDETLLRPLR